MSKKQKLSNYWEKAPESKARLTKRKDIKNLVWKINIKV